MGGGPLQWHESEAHEQLQTSDADAARLGAHDRVRVVAGSGQHACQHRGVLVATHRVEGDTGPPAHVAQVGCVAQREVVRLVEQALQHGGGFVSVEQSSNIADELVGFLLVHGAVRALEARVTHLSFGSDEPPCAVQPVGMVSLQVQADGLRQVLTVRHGCLELRVVQSVVRMQVHGGHDGVGLREREGDQLVLLEPGDAGIDTSLRAQRVELDVHGQGHVFRLERRVSDDRVGHVSHLGFLVGKVVVLSDEKEYNIYGK